MTMGLMCYVSAAKSDDADIVIVDATTRAERATLSARSPNMEHETSLVMYSYYWIVPLPPPSLYGCGAERLHFILDAQGAWRRQLRLGISCLPTLIGEAGSTTGAYSDAQD